MKYFHLNLVAEDCELINQFTIAITETNDETNQAAEDPEVDIIYTTEELENYPDPFALDSAIIRYIKNHIGRKE